MMLKIGVNYFQLQKGSNLEVLLVAEELAKAQVFERGYKTWTKAEEPEISILMIPRIPDESDTDGMTVAAPVVPGEGS